MNAVYLKVYIFCLLAFGTNCTFAQRFTFQGILRPPQDYPIQYYDFGTADGTDFLKLTGSNIFIRAYTDTSVHWFTIKGNKFVFKQRIKAPHKVGIHFAEDIDVFGDMLAVADRMGTGARYVDEYEGKVFLYKKKDKWEYLQELKSPRIKGDNFGDQLAISDSLLIVQAPWAWTAGGVYDDKVNTSALLYKLNAAGRWQLFGRLPKTHTPKQSIMPVFLSKRQILYPLERSIRIVDYLNDKLILGKEFTPKNGSYFGKFAASSEHLVGVYDNGGSRAKAAFIVYQKNKTAWVNPQVIETSYRDRIITSITMDSGYIAVGLARPNSLNSIDPIPGKVQIYKYNIANNQWRLLHEIIAPDSHPGDRFGAFVKLEKGNMIILSDPEYYRVLEKFFKEKNAIETMKKVKKHADVYFYSLLSK